jgi:hypothetical protein
MSETTRNRSEEPWPEGVPRPGELGRSDSEEDWPLPPATGLTEEEANPRPGDPLYSPYYTPAQVKSIKEALWRRPARSDYTITRDSQGNEFKRYHRRGAFE